MVAGSCFGTIWNGFLARRWAILALMAILLRGGLGAAALTTVQDTLVRADGRYFTGIVEITWQAFQAADGTSVPGGSKRLDVRDGFLMVTLVPFGAYQVRYIADNRVVARENWAVPETALPVRVSALRTILYGDMSATSIHGVPISAVAPANGQTLVFAEGEWRPSDGFAPSAHLHDADYPRLDGSYSNPTWLTSIDWAKLTGVPSTFAPATHAASHQHGGADEIATATPGANAIPKAGLGGTLASGWIPDLSGVYSLTSHNHSGVYAPASHTHAYTDVLSAPWPAYSSGASPPTGGCTAPAVYAETGTDPDTMYHCSGGTWQQIGGTASAGDSWTGEVDLGYVESGRTVCGTFAASGATVGTALAPSWPALEDGLHGLSMRVSVANTIEVCAINDSLSAIDPAAATFAASANGGMAVAGGSASFPPMTGKAGYSLKVNSTATDVEWNQDIPGAGLAKTPVAGGEVWSVDSTQIAYLALNNAFLGDQAFAGRVVTTPSTAQTLAAGDAITVSTATTIITSAGDVTLTSAPTIAAGSDGQHVWIVNAGAYSITLQDGDVLAGSNLCTIGNANLVIAAKAACHLLYSAAAACWIEVK